MKVLIRAIGVSVVVASLAACAGAGPMGEPAQGVQGLKNAAATSESTKGDAAAPRGGGSAEAPTGPDGAPTAGPTDAIGPH